MQIEITKQSEKDFRFLLSRLSHEIRNPVTLINSELQLMASSHQELSSYRQWDSLMDNLEYVKELLKELSDFSHAQTVTLVPVNPAEFLTTVLSCQKNTLDYLGIRLEIHVEHPSSPVFLDRIKMRQVIFNLIKNSCEAIDQPGGKIIVNLTHADSGICICIKDNGCGMTHKQTENIFHPFITYKPEGTGLGLSISKLFADILGGKLWVKSKVGEGSTFFLTLPQE